VEHIANIVQIFKGFYKELFILPALLRKLCALERQLEQQIYALKMHLTPLTRISPNLKNLRSATKNLGFSGDV